MTTPAPTGPDATPLRQCSLCGAWGYGMILSLGGLVVCQACDNRFKRTSGQEAGNEIQGNLAKLKLLE